MRVAVTGSHGMVGRAVMQALRARGDEVVRVVRSFKDVAARERVVVWHPAKKQIEGQKLEALDAVIHLAGESIFGVWTPGKKRAIRASRVQGTELLARALAARQSKPAVLITASGIGVYGTSRGLEPLDETSEPGTGFMAETVVAWERAADPAREAGIRVVHARFANILSASGGFLRVLLPFFRLGLGAKFGAGDQVWPWVTLEDVVRAILFICDAPSLAGPVNIVAPDTVTNAGLTAEIARAVNRPSMLRAPAFALRLAPGHMAEELLLGGQNVIPARLRDAGFVFRHPRLREALSSILKP